jgi:hypothetical protein
MEHGPCERYLLPSNTGGGKFVGWCAAMVNIFKGNFACSPAYFDGNNVKMSELADAAVRENIPHQYKMDGMTRELHRCLAAMVFHHETILQLCCDG